MAPPLVYEFTRPEVTAQLRALGVREGAVLLVHTSYRAVRPVAGGVLGLIAALRDALGPEGTLVMPTMTDGESVFDPARTPTLDMGATAEAFWRQQAVVRSTHPGASFAAQGPRAEEVCAPQPLEPPHGVDSPVGRVHALGGQVLLLGVTQGESTTVHLAESIAAVPYSVAHPCVVVIDGEIRTVFIAETDHCCENFSLADGWLREGGLLREGPVGHAHARLYEARDLVRVVTERLAREPLVFLCDPEAGCEECDLARASVSTASAPAGQDRPVG